MENCWAKVLPLKTVFLQLSLETGRLNDNSVEKWRMVDARERASTRREKKMESNSERVIKITGRYDKEVEANCW